MPRARRSVVDRDWEGASLRDQVRGAFTEVIGERPGIKSRGHGNDFQVRAFRPLEFKTAGETNVGKEMAFVEFVEDDSGNAL